MPRPIKTITNYVGIPEEKPYKNWVPNTGQLCIKISFNIQEKLKKLPKNKRIIQDKS